MIQTKRKQNQYFPFKKKNYQSFRLIQSNQVFQVKDS